ncbi:stalk domain-containing protein [Paenibacillus xylanexedens]|uniref:stalk domain-containing protein n=1 Tax=Paenibacillus xylanexedens TaxID=528191 RepID=UPI000F9A6BBE|nr:stalk domain-containing protein [Paenibacillus xylanexedens]RPK24273.1 hypothetical protein EDO6_05217 [Paenibacillus xylanexedens]
MNGATVTAKDANGKTVLPITYNGTTYLPVRAVGSLLGTEITYDSATSSVLIGGKNETGPVTINKVTLSTLGTTVLGSTAWHTKDPGFTRVTLMAKIKNDDHLCNAWIGIQDA